MCDFIFDYSSRVLIDLKSIFCVTGNKNEYCNERYKICNLTLTVSQHYLVKLTSIAQLWQRNRAKLVVFD